MNEKIGDCIELYKLYHDELYLENILTSFSPLVNLYARKLYYLEYEDSVQELNIAIYEALDSIKKTESECACISYIKKAVIHRFCKLYHKSVKAKEYMDMQYPLVDDIVSKPYIALEDRIAYYDFERLLATKSKKEKQIFNMLLYGYSDKEIAFKLGFSRQYINRIKKRL